MDENTLKDVLRDMANAPAGRSVDIASVRTSVRRRRIAWTAGGAVAFVVIVAGLIGSAVALSGQNDADNPPTIATPGPSKSSTTSSSPAPTAASACGSSSVPVTFGVASVTGDGADTPTAAAAPWVGANEAASDVGRTADGKALVAITAAKDDSVLRVLTVAPFRNDWFVESTTGCGTVTKAETCGVSIDIDGVTFSRSPDQPPNLGVGRPLAQGQTSACFGIQTGQGTVAFAQPVAPVTAFQENEADPQSTVVINVDEDTLLLQSAP